MTSDIYSDLWKRDLGSGRYVVMARALQDYRASYDGFHGYGATPEVAIANLMVRMRSYCVASEDFDRSLKPGGQLHTKLQQLHEAVEQVVASRSSS
jgi:hypothetical protein